jgi:hypothetical protein
MDSSWLGVGSNPPDLGIEIVGEKNINFFLSKLISEANV